MNISIHPQHPAIAGQFSTGSATLQYNFSFIGQGYCIQSSTGAKLKREAAVPESFEAPFAGEELHFFRTLDRKAKGGLLSAYENAAYEALLEIQLYKRIKALHPELSHFDLLQACTLAA
ncbi:MAG: hypothetical protein MUF24_01465 [Chitinophagaceae bacterium]|jgi:hypothetical protein|nr:hypothetical protein [Chitinophagaceae bacterium]